MSGLLVYPNYATPSNLKEEKKLIASGLTQKIMDRHKWYIISWSWFSQWKEYVDFDNAFSDSNGEDDKVRT